MNRIIESSKAVVYMDLAGSMRLYESLGNRQGSAIVSTLTTWLAELCVQQRGEVVKYLGDGLIMTFAGSEPAIQAAITAQSFHAKNIPNYPNECRIHIKIGIALGAIIQYRNDIFGDTVRLATGLCNMASAGQILVDACIARDGHAQQKYQLQQLGHFSIKNYAGKVAVHQIEWEDASNAYFTTLPAPLAHPPVATEPSTRQALTIRLQDTAFSISSDNLPFTIGRSSECSLVVQDARVSRFHATIDFRDGVFYLCDTSSYGTQVLFDEAVTGLRLRRMECGLNGNGKIILGNTGQPPRMEAIEFEVNTAP